MSSREPDTKRVRNSILRTPRQRKQKQSRFRDNAARHSRLRQHVKRNYGRGLAQMFDATADNAGCRYPRSDTNLPYSIDPVLRSTIITTRILNPLFVHKGNQQRFFVSGAAVVF